MGGGYDPTGFEIGNVLDARAYPLARRNRTGPAPSGAQAGILTSDPSTPPRMRVFPFVFNETATSRRAWSGNQCTGPALIKDLFIGTSAHATPTNKTVEIGIASTRITEAGVALATPRPYTLLTELLDPFNVVLDAAGGGIPDTTTAPNAASQRVKLDLVVYDAQFFPVLALVNNTGNAQEWHGWFRVLEQIPLSKLGDYMG